MAYKIRPFNSLEEALSYAVEQLGDEKISLVTGKSASYIRKCSDPDSDQNLPFNLATKIDLECVINGKGTPLLNFFENHIEENTNPEQIKDHLLGILGQLSHNSNRIVEKSIAALDENSPGGSKITQSELKEISYAIKKIEEKILNLKIKVQEHTI
tara:strand:+ start:583 stop:1050 length:468 start_codon:yes stop_codon:yes gene_type:complete